MQDSPCGNGISARNVQYSRFHFRAAAISACPSPTNSSQHECQSQQDCGPHLGNVHPCSKGGYVSLCSHLQQCLKHIISQLGVSASDRHLEAAILEVCFVILNG